MDQGFSPQHRGWINLSWALLCAPQETSHHRQPLPLDSSSKLQVVTTKHVSDIPSVPVGAESPLVEKPCCVDLTTLRLFERWASATADSGPSQSARRSEHLPARSFPESWACCQGCRCSHRGIGEEGRGHALPGLLYASLGNRGLLLALF